MQIQIKPEFKTRILIGLLGTFRSEDEDDYEYEFSVLNMRIQGSKFIFGFGSTCATRCTFLGALPKF